MCIYYLYVKTHNITGLKYLGKTVSKNPHQYKGSGIYWSSHIKKHGYDVTTEILKECLSEYELQYWGKYYSELWDIVNKTDSSGRKVWANLRPEEGTGGWGGEQNPNNLPHIIQAKRERMLGEENPARNKETKDKIKKNTKLAMNKPEVKQKHLEAVHSDSWLEKRRNRVGETAPNYDKTKYQFIHESGIKENCTKHELITKYGKHINPHRLINRQLKTSGGWRLDL